MTLSTLRSEFHVVMYVGSSSSSSRHIHTQEVESKTLDARTCRVERASRRVKCDPRAASLKINAHHCLIVCPCNKHPTLFQQHTQTCRASSIRTVPPNGCSRTTQALAATNRRHHRRDGRSRMQQTSSRSLLGEMSTVAWSAPVSQRAISKRRCWRSSHRISGP
jgi:hypothetical protein